LGTADLCERGEFFSPRQQLDRSRSCSSVAFNSVAATPDSLATLRPANSATTAAPATMKARRIGDNLEANGFIFGCISAGSEAGRSKASRCLWLSSIDINKAQKGSFF
jgi:hypothetical protein